MANSGSDIINYYKQFVKLTSGKQKDFWVWKVKNAQVLTHVKTDDIRKQYPEIDEYLKNNKRNINYKECFKNAGQLCIEVEGVDYVEGEISFKGIPIEHAWNKIDGKYFDITKDILFPDDEDYAEYVKIIELDTKEYTRFMFKHKHWGGFILEKFLKDNKLEESYYPRLFEDSLDLARERMFGIPVTKEPEYDEFAKDQIIAKVKGGYGETNIIKNPTTLKGIDGDSRGIIDNDGNLYVIQKNIATHTEILNVLDKLGLIYMIDRWWKKIPDNFVTIQRVWNENKFVIGESNEVLLKDYNTPEERKEWNMPSIGKARKYFLPFIEIARIRNPQYKFYEYVIDEINDKLRKGTLKESSAMDKYYEKNFGITRDYDTYVDKDKNDVVAKIEGTPIVKNPKNLAGFDDSVRAIADRNGNLYVALNDGLFNHGEMANALIKAGVIQTIWYDVQGDTAEEVAGIYEDQKNFLLLSRLYDKNMFVQSDTFEWEGNETERIVNLLKRKHPQFKINLRYAVDW